MPDLISPDLNLHDAMHLKHFECVAAMHLTLFWALTSCFHGVARADLVAIISLVMVDSAFDHAYM